ncbi:hypothetical protein ACFWOY_33180 [Streptomyces sp. NPDC058423]|uniref:hypothetical protein n=1 Tax=unclassified Streptomyces TaxID=2593676 RepID=UPI00365F7116
MLFGGEHIGDVATSGGRVLDDAQTVRLLAEETKPAESVGRDVFSAVEYCRKGKVDSATPVTVLSTRDPMRLCEAPAVDASGPASVMGMARYGPPLITTDGHWRYWELVVPIRCGLVSLLRIRRLAKLGGPISLISDVSAGADNTSSVLRELDAELQMSISTAMRRPQTSLRPSAGAHRRTLPPDSRP